MKSVSKDQFKKDIIKFFCNETKMTIKQNERIKVSNVTLFYCNNANYAGGLKNGYGKGWYISNGGFTGGSTIKLFSKL